MVVGILHCSDQSCSMSSVLAWCSLQINGSSWQLDSVFVWFCPERMLQYPCRVRCQHLLIHFKLRKFCPQYWEGPWNVKCQRYQPLGIQENPWPCPPLRYYYLLLLIWATCDYLSVGTSILTQSNFSIGIFVVQFILSWIIKGIKIIFICCRTSF